MQLSCPRRLSASCRCERRWLSCRPCQNITTYYGIFINKNISELPALGHIHERREPDPRQGRGRGIEPGGRVEGELALNLRVDSLSVPEVVRKSREHIGERQGLRILGRDFFRSESAVRI